MASTLRALNSIGGFSVGDDPQIVIIQANGDINSGNITANGFANINGNLVANAANFSGNLNISNANATWGVLTDNLYYSNGAPWDLSNPAGSNGYIQYNDNGSFGASSNFQFTAATNTLQVTGLANVTGNINVTQSLNGNVANFSGNLTALNASLGNLATANYVNVAVDLLVSGNANIVLDLQGNTANFSGNIKALNANLGNLGTANFINVSSNLNVTNTATVGNLSVTANVTSNLIPNVSNTYTLGNATNMWKDLYLSGTSIYIGTQNITSNATTIAVSNDFGANNFFATNNVSANGNVYANAGGGAGYVYANFANVQSNLYVGANANIVNTLTAANIKDTNLSNTQLVFANAANTLTGSANLTFDFASQTLSVTGTANVSGDLNGNVGNFSGNLTSLNANLGNLATANYVNVATLTANTTVNFTSASNVSLGPVGNVHITGGSNGQVLQTDGLGNLSWSSTANINEIHNGTSNVYIPTANGNVTITANGSQTWTFGTDGKLSTAGDIQANGTVNANYITAALSITSSGNIYANTGYVYANYANVNNDLQVNNNANIGNTLTANTANVTTLNVANVTTTGNITANNVTVNLELAGNTANFSGNVFLNANANVTNNLGVGGNITTSGASGNITMSGGNINGVNYLFANAANITNLLQGNTANFTGNVDAVNFIGNLANGASNVQIDNGGNIRFSPGTGYANAVIISSGGIDTIGYVTANGNITSNTGFVSNTVTAFANTPLTLNAGTAAGAANINVVLVPSGNGTVDVSSKRITNVATPTGDTDAANKAYVDSVAQGLNIKASVYVATYAALPAYTYNNGTSGVGATITANAFGALVVDGQTISTVGTRVLVKNETAGNAPYNGIYTLTTAGGVAAYFVLTRSLDMNVAAEFDGAFTFVSVGTNNADTGWVQTGEIVTVGTTPVVWTQFSGAGQYTANTSAGLSLTGTIFSAKVDGNIHPTTAFDGQGNIYVPAGAAFTTPNIGAATGTSVDLSGNVLAGNINSNAMITTANLEVSVGIITGNITANASANIVGNLTANNATVTNLLTVSGNANVALTLNGNVANFSGNLTAANANLGNLATANYVNVSTQINGNVANFSGNLTAANANLGNLVEANYVNVANNLNVTGTANIANVSISGNITANNITSNNRVSATNLKIGNSYIYANTVTTVSTSPLEIASFMITNTDVYGIEYIVKSYDGTGSKYSMATVQAVTNGTDVNYVTFATVRLGNTTGALSVTRTAVGLDVSINLVATPSTSNSTIWTTQYRLI
jgi:hypothetical protein